MSLLKRRLAHERGNAAVEFAILVPVLVALVFGAIDFARIFYAYVAVANAAHEAAVVAARYDGGPTMVQTAIALGTPNPLSTAIASESNGFLSVVSAPPTPVCSHGLCTPTPIPSGNANISGPFVVYNTPVGTPVGSVVPMAQVQVTYNFQPVTPFPLKGPVSVSAVSAAPLP